MRRLLCSFSFVLTLSCNSELPEESDTSGSEDIAIVVEPTHGTLPLDFRVRAFGTGNGLFEVLDIKGNLGFVLVDGEKLPALIYLRQPWDEFSLTLFQGITVANDRIYVFWLYCNEGELQSVWLEGTDGTSLHREPYSGTCVDSFSPITPVVEFPAIKMPIPELVDGLEAFGPAVDISGANPGWLETESGRLTVFAFERLDCTTDCGTPGWWEYHALLWDRQSGRICFAIFYFFPGSGDVLVTYSLTLPTLQDLVGTLSLEASWTIDGVGPR